ncbi:hypothetical protein K7432_010382 [Basidiobolus ranarum]|uniref:Uncharacterized protein n=1 Tax=Basidiobolus ranarum TaxID=34480 RepID=A0ABR2VVK6_9FUNG
MEANRRLCRVALLIMYLFTLVVVDAGSCKDCLFSLPFRATPGCQDFEYDKELKPFNPTDLYKKCSCQLKDAPQHFDLCNQICTQSEVSSIKSQINAAGIFNCNKVLGKSAAPSGLLTSNTAWMVGVIMSNLISHLLLM